MGPEQSLWVIHRALCNGALIPVYTESTGSFSSTTLNTRRIPWFLDLGIELQLNYREQSICLDTLRGEIGEHYVPRVKDSRSTSRLSEHGTLPGMFRASVLPNSLSTHPRSLRMPSAQCAQGFLTLSSSGPQGSIISLCWSWLLWLKSKLCLQNFLSEMFISVFLFPHLMFQPFEISVFLLGVPCFLTTVQKIVWPCYLKKYSQYLLIYLPISHSPYSTQSSISHLNSSLCSLLELTPLNPYSLKLL